MLLSISVRRSNADAAFRASMIDIFIAHGMLHQAVVARGNGYTGPLDLPTIIPTMPIIIKITPAPKAT
jgi:hypothetical protein